VPDDADAQATTVLGTPEPMGSTGPMGPTEPFEPGEPVSRRDRPAKELLSRAAIIDAALELVRRSGLEQVTLRQVAAQLDTGAASLYVYVANRDDLVRRMLDRVLSEVEPVPVKPKRWRRRLAELFTEMLAVLDRYPGIATVALSSLPAPISTGAIRANGLELLAAGGVKEQQASWICDSLLLHTIATAVDVDHDPDRFAFAIAALIESGRDR
jgi:AcrR family transcriptional regulator